MTEPKTGDSHPRTDDPRPDFPGGGGEAPVTDVRESDPNADSAEGLTGEMGVSSERVGVLRGSDEEGATGAMETFEPLPEGDLPPEQSSDQTHDEPNPDPPVLKHHLHVSGM